MWYNPFQLYMGKDRFVPGENCNNNCVDACINGSLLDHELNTYDSTDSLSSTSVNVLVNRQDCGHPSSANARERANTIIDSK